MPERMDNDRDAEQDDAAPSKSERKRQMHALQALGESLLSLNDQQLAQIPIEDEQLLLAIQECRQIRSNSARKRHLQLIGKLMRNIDPAPVEKALAAMHQGQRQSTAVFHELEQLRDNILADGTAGAELAMARWPDADRQQLRQLVLRHQREVQLNKPPAASRRLFRYLRELQEIYGAAD